MNHIEKLQFQLNATVRELQAFHNAINDLESYLLSPKFHQDTTVQVQDVFNRLREAERHSAEQREAFERSYVHEADRPVATISWCEPERLYYAYDENENLIIQSSGKSELRKFLHAKGYRCIS